MPGQARPGRVGRRDGKVMDGFPRVVDMSSGAGRVPSVMGWVGAHEWYKALQCNGEVGELKLSTKVGCNFRRKK